LGANIVLFHVLKKVDFLLFPAYPNKKRNLFKNKNQFLYL